ncbi:MAG: cupin domain-containing protein [Patescibacteria group bacterium]
MEKLEKEGFKYVFEWTDAPGTEYPSHSHKDKVSIYVVSGSIDFNVEGNKITVDKGSRFNVPPGKEHTAKVGAYGCSFVVGEMIKGDS